jgi:glutaredoxin
MLALLLAVLSVSPALEDARAQLALGKLDGVLFALQPAQAVTKEEAKDAAALLLQAAQLAQARSDKPMALQLAQMSLRRDPAAPGGYKLLAEWSLLDSEFNLAIKYAKGWVKAEPQSEDAKSFLERTEEAERSWQPPSTDRVRRKRRGKRADAPVLKSQSAAGVAPRRWSAVGGVPTTEAPAGKVVLYGTSWCGVCTQARSWLAGRGIAFDDKDIEVDKVAAIELHDKEKKARVQHRGVPVIEVNGRLMAAGFSPGAIEYALRHGR